MFKYFIGVTMKSRIVMVNPKRNMAIKRRQIPYHRYVKSSEYKKLLIDNLDMELSEARNVLKYQKQIFDIPIDHIIEQCLLIKKFNIDTKSLYMNADLLGWSSKMLENRVFLYRDMGVTQLHAAVVSNFPYLMNVHMRLFKGYTGIPEDVNVAKKLLSCLDRAPDGVEPLEELSDGLSVRDYQERCLRWYVEWRLQIPRENEQLMNRVIEYLRFKSFSRMNGLYDILHHEVGLTLEEIKNTECLALGRAENLREIIDNARTFGGVDFKQIIKKKPTLLRINYADAVELDMLFEKHGFKNIVLKHCLNILSTSKKALMYGFEQFEREPELRILRHNPNSVRLIYKSNMVKLRLNYLRYLNRKHDTVRSLTGNRVAFERYLQTSIDKTRGREIGRSFEKILRIEAKELRRTVERHPYWRHIGLVSMHETVNFLLKRFQPEDLHDNLQLILYPREKVKESLDSLPELNQTSSKKKIKYSGKHILALVLYEIEREYNFTGDGVWEYETLQAIQSEASKIHESESLSDYSDSEGTEIDELPNEQTSYKCKEKCE